MKYSILIFLLIFSLACNENQISISSKNIVKISSIINHKSDSNYYHQINYIPLPEGFSFIKNEKNSFAAWLENVPLKRDKTVFLFDGSQKKNQSAQFAVVDISVGEKNVQQCADAVMRLRSEYLFSQQKFKEIVFIDNAGKEYRFTSPFTQQNFSVYLEKVFGMCGSASLAKQLKAVNEFSKIKAGDVIIKGGFPGHAVIVMGVAINDMGKKIFLLAQSYMPAQDVHVLLNPTIEKLSPWYRVVKENIIITPEFVFHHNQLMEW